MSSYRRIGLVVLVVLAGCSGFFGETGDGGELKNPTPAEASVERVEVEPLQTLPYTAEVTVHGSIKNGALAVGFVNRGLRLLNQTDMSDGVGTVQIPLAMNITGHRLYGTTKVKLVIWAIPTDGNTGENIVMVTETTNRRAQPIYTESMTFDGPDLQINQISATVGLAKFSPQAIKRVAASVTNSGGLPVNIDRIAMVSKRGNGTTPELNRTVASGQTITIRTETNGVFSPPLSANDSRVEFIFQDSFGNQLASANKTLPGAQVRITNINFDVFRYQYTGGGSINGLTITAANTGTPIQISGARLVIRGNESEYPMFKNLTAGSKEAIEIPIIRNLEDGRYAATVELISYGTVIAKVETTVTI